MQDLSLAPLTGVSLQNVTCDSMVLTNFFIVAPEVIELKGASTKSDIWSLGCTLMELLTGKPPYADLIAMSAMFRIVEDDLPPLPDNISDECTSFLTACFQKDPQKRLSAAELKNHAWIIQNGQRIRKTETCSHDLSSYLQSLEEVTHPNESQVTLIEEEDEEERKVPLGLRDEEDYITHRFIHTSFGKGKCTHDERLPPCRLRFSFFLYSG